MLIEILVVCLGIVLKKARMIKKGTHNTNVSDSGLIDTLVVLAGDLVQVVAKVFTRLYLTMLFKSFNWS